MRSIHTPINECACRFMNIRAKLVNWVQMPAYAAP